MRTAFAVIAIALSCEPRSDRRVDVPPSPAVARSETPEQTQSPPPSPTHHSLRVEPAPHAVPEGAPTVSVHASSGDTAQGWVVFLHGWNGCVQVLVGEGVRSCVDGGPERPGWNLGGLHTEAGTTTVFVVPQLRWLARDGSPGRFAEPAFFGRFLADVARATALPPPSEPISILAHSAGYETALAILQHHGQRVRDLVLFDALYSGAEAIAEWLCSAEQRRVVTYHTGQGSPQRQSRRLAAAASRCNATITENPERLDQAVEQARVVILETDIAHGAIPKATLIPVLQALYPAAPPQRERPRP